MKKNITTVIILALVIMNLLLTTIIMFVMVPSLSKVNTLVTQVASIINLETTDPNSTGGGHVAIADREVYTVEKALAITLKMDADKKLHYAAIDSVSLTINKKADSYKEVSGAMEANRDFICEIVSNTYAKYTLTEATANGDKIKVEILEAINKHFDGTDAIIDISLSNRRFQ